jgi:hypothetical protein
MPGPCPTNGQDLPQMERLRLKLGELAVPAILIGLWIVLQLVVLPRMGVST